MTNDNLIEFAKLEALLFDTPEAINTKLAVVKEALTDGTYRINNQHIATKLLEYARITETAEAV